MEPTMTKPELMIDRVEARSNVFLAAMIDMPGGALPVRLRNLSSRGALVEGAVLPIEGAVHIRRGDLHVRGQVVWVHDRYCGLHFDAMIDVPAWLKRIGHQGQERVDQIMASLRNGAIPKAANPPPPQRPAHVAEALLEIAEWLAAMDGLSVEAGEQVLKIETLARTIQTWSPSRGLA
jgi:hypothetical protein